MWKQRSIQCQFTPLFLITSSIKKSEILFISCKSYHVIVIKSILIFSLVSITNFYPHWLLPMHVLNLDILFLWLEINTFPSQVFATAIKEKIYCLLHFPFLLLYSWVRYALNLFTYSVCNAIFNFKILYQK